MDTQPPPVAHPVMYHQWNRITFLHWRYPPGVVQSFLPAGLTADTCDGDGMGGADAVVAGRLAAAEAEHPRWPLRHAGMLGLDQNLLAAAALPAPAGGPLAHVSPGVAVRIGMWHFL